MFSLCGRCGKDLVVMWERDEQEGGKGGEERDEREGENERGRKRKEGEKRGEGEREKGRK